MDGKGRATDNAFIESLWKLLKYENIYLYVYETGIELYIGVKKYFLYFNNHRRHSSIGDKFPVELYDKSLLTKAL